MYILGIETTCDETGASVVRSGREILSNIVATQVALHAHYGGVFPEMASRQHVDMILPSIKRSLEEADIKASDLQGIAVAVEPGLMGALLIGVNTAKTLALSWNIPFIGVNHIEAHLYAAMMEQPIDTISFPAIGVVLSGGHTALFKIEGLGQYSLISETVDDAMGEAFDKVARLLELPYPGGPEIEKIALKGNISSFPLTAGKVKGSSYHFSFSGIKTQILYLLQGQDSSRPLKKPLHEQAKANIAASFQHTVCIDVVKKTIAAAQHHQCQTIFLGGGVTNNRYLRALFHQHAPPTFSLHWPSSGLSLDNAAMIAGLGYHYLSMYPVGSSYDLVSSPRSSCLFPS